MVYAGTTSLTQTSDILLGRYAAVGQEDVAAGVAGAKSAQPSQMAQPMPRVFQEKLQRDPKFGFFTSQDLAWIRPLP